MCVHNHAERILFLAFADLHQITKKKSFMWLLPELYVVLWLNIDEVVVGDELVDCVVNTFDVGDVSTDSVPENTQQFKIRTWDSRISEMTQERCRYVYIVSFVPHMKAKKYVYA